MIRVLDDPFGAGGLKPVAMQRALELLDRGRRVVDASGPLPCDARGGALAAAVITPFG